MKMPCLPSRPWLVPVSRACFRRHPAIVAGWNRNHPLNGQVFSFIDQFYDDLICFRFAAIPIIIILSAAAFDVSIPKFLLLLSVPLLFFTYRKNVRRPIRLYPTIRALWKNYRALLRVSAIARLPASASHEKARDIAEDFMLGCAQHDLEEGIFHGDRHEVTTVEEERLSLTYNHESLFRPFGLCKPSHIYMVRVKEV